MNGELGFFLDGTELHRSYLDIVATLRQRYSSHKTCNTSADHRHVQRLMAFLGREAIGGQTPIVLCFVNDLILHF